MQLEGFRIGCRFKKFEAFAWKVVHTIHEAKRACSERPESKNQKQQKSVQDKLEKLESKYTKLAQEIAAFVEENIKSLHPEMDIEILVPESRFDNYGGKVYFANETEFKNYLKELKNTKKASQKRPEEPRQSDFRGKELQIFQSQETHSRFAEEFDASSSKLKQNKNRKWVKNKTKVGYASFEDAL